MTTRDDDILDFDFFDEEDAPSWEEPVDPGPGHAARRGGRAVARARAFALPERDAAPAADRARRARRSSSSSCSPSGPKGAPPTPSAIATRRTWRRSERSETRRRGSGRRSSTLLTTPGLNQEDLDAKLGGYVQTAENQVRPADDLDARARWRPNTGAVEALQYRANGLRGLQTAFKETVDETDASIAGGELLVQTRRLLASDIIWRTRSRRLPRPCCRTRASRGSGSVVAVRHRRRSRQPSSLAAIWQRIQGASTGGTPTGLHGSGIASVTALPSGQLLSTTTETTIMVTDELAFEVGVEDTGESQEVRIKVTLTIPKEPEPIVKTQTIPIIDPGETKSVTRQVGSSCRSASRPR